MNRLSVVAAAVLLAGGLSVAAAGNAQATVGVMNCGFTFEINLSLGLVNGYECTGSLTGVTGGTINDTGLHRSYECTSLRLLPVVHGVSGGGCVRRR